jgi:methyltransferase (TIGR00027 family)
MPEHLIRDVSDTAIMIAAYRAVESERKDALFDDPFAAKLAGERGRRMLTSPPVTFGGGRGGALFAKIMIWSVALRTHIIDDFILQAISQGTDAVLCLGAGLDTRPYRMSLPESLCWIEVDLPQIIELKESELPDERPRCRLERVRLDLTDVPARRRLLAGVGARFRQVLVLTEGLIPYLTVEVAGELADELRSQPTFARWIVDYFSAGVLRSSNSVRWRMPNAPFRFFPADYFGFFKAHGWDVSQARYLSEEGRRLRRPAPFPWLMRVLIQLRLAFMSRAKRKAAARTLGYLLLEPAAGSSAAGS